MMNAHQKALIKTALTVGIVAIILAAATVWPSVVGYAAVIISVGFFLTLLYGMFYMYEDTKDWRKKP